MMNGLLLGLSSGASCLASCAPMLLSLLAAQAREGRRGFDLLLAFLLGRAGAYAALGALAWSFGAGVERWPAWHSLLLGLALVASAIFLLRYGFVAEPPRIVAGGSGAACVCRRSYRTPRLAAAGGLATGLSPCAPVLLAFAAAAQSRRLIEAMAFFLCFFVGTSLYLLPLPWLGFLGRWDRLRWVARFAVGLMGAYYVYAGTVAIINGTRLIWLTK